METDAEYVVYGDSGEKVLEYRWGADYMRYEGRRVTVDRAGKRVTLSDSSGELGYSRSSYKKIWISNGDVYKRRWKLFPRIYEYAIEGVVRARVRYCMGDNSQTVQMIVGDDAFTPFLFLSILRAIYSDPSSSRALKPPLGSL
jgi:hypothetical protein